MQYRKNPKNGDELSLLGFGCMRFPTRLGRIDEAASDKLLLQAIELGVNYFDTGWPYHMGQSESYLGSFFERSGTRDQVKLADKLPIWAVKRREDMDSFLDKQLAKLKSKQIDYYLLHALTSWDRWEELKALRLFEFIEQAKANGRIKNIGFSFHGDGLTFQKIIDDYPWDFCQIQYNILDECHQAGKTGLEYAHKKGIPVMIMEPLRGGLLGNQVPNDAKKALKGTGIDRSPASWFMRWVMEKEGVVTVLSGMNQAEHIKENCETATHATIGCMSDVELQAIESVKAIYQSTLKVPCTGCQYCMPCPYGVNIPRCFEFYNNQFIFKKRTQRFLYMLWLMDALNAPGDASLCQNCGKCVKHCPQHIAIPERLADVRREMERWYLKPLMPIIRLVMGRRREKDS